MKKRIISVILALVLIFPLMISCKGKNDDADGIIRETNIDLVKNGTSEFTIVIPENANDYEIYAASELVDVFKQSTGFELPVVSDSGLEFDTAAHILSIGRTTVLLGSGVSADKSLLGRDGFRLVTKNNTAIMVGGEGYGTLYAVYEFLERNIGYQCYAIDEIVVPKVSAKKLLSFNMTEIPAFVDRGGKFYHNAQPGNIRFAARMRTLVLYGTQLFVEDNLWANWSHTHFLIMPKEKYHTDYPDWYSEDGFQLNLTNDDMRAEFTKNVQSLILANPNAVYVMLGQQDRNTFCTCAKCKESNAAYGGPAGTMMRFINAVARDIKSWLAVEQPGREVKLVTFAYNMTFPAPTDENHQPVHESVIAEDNVAIMFANIDSAYDVNIFDDANKLTRDSLIGWSNISENIFVWAYSTNFSEYMIFFNNLSALAENYQIFHEHNVKFLYDQSTDLTPGTPFQTLRLYLHSKLMWDPYQNVNVLIDDFITNYFKNVSPQISEYFDMLRYHYSTMQQYYKEKGLDFYTYVYTFKGLPIMTAEMWPKKMLLQMQNILDDAFRVIDTIQDLNLKQKLYNRVLSETLSVRYLLIDIHGSSFYKNEIAEMIDSFEKDAATIGLILTAQYPDKTTAEKIQDWRNAFL